MPPIGQEKYLICIWDELGQSGRSMDGPTAFSPTEVKAWSEMSATPLNPWEFKVLLRASRDYCNQLVAGREKDCPAPYGSPTLIFDRGWLSRKLRVEFKALIKASKRK